MRLSAEIALIIIFLLFVTPHQQNNAPDRRIHGAEFSYLVSSGVIAANVYHQTGSIPVWNPFMGRGEPLIESPFSFVLNPLMTLPIFWFGLHPGTKIALLLHILLMGIGGWTLGYSLKLGPPGRLFLGLVLGCSGSMAGAISEGFYQMALSQAYVPWVYAGLIGTLYGHERWPVGVLVVATSLLLFAGTFWYVLPTVLVSVLIVLFALIQNRRTFWTQIKRLLIAAGFTFLVSAVRLIPVVMNSAYIGDHPRELLDHGTQDFGVMLRLLFDSQLTFPRYALYYHYTLPVVFVIVVGIVWVYLALNDRLPEMPHRWRILIPAGVMIFIFCGLVTGRYILFTLAVFDIFVSVGMAAAGADVGGGLIPAGHDHVDAVLRYSVRAVVPSFYPRDKGLWFAGAVLSCHLDGGRCQRQLEPVTFDTGD